mmetsp:Transcript_572/g.882  ORF Transcript_572/g.882 Transcript_572/m.882 type:complete len:431 (+) Transcript_572:58-1350(+)|eukprot:CAMPEP_0194210898 /NCGR_PEP_ID=MMETSP0156-20130528/9170_1 /TAXON_ID=33649 /ORGANISM="Thalassionema nitzschioides, Strain L26-B" /LENGTH=430 /DNA_ID=CAMNT_0038938309 /DNA_START=57 /DNA_END=1349 /DNA_ORIENTATION=+
MRFLELVIFIAILTEASCASQLKGFKDAEQIWNQERKHERERVLKTHGRRKTGKKRGVDDDDEESDTYLSLKKGSKKRSKKSSKKHRDDDDVCFPTVSVANELDGTLSILDASSGELLDTMKIPRSRREMSQSVPLDVETSNGVIYISDYENNRILAIDGHTLELLASIPTGDGPSEMSIDAIGHYLWVTCLLDNTVIVIDLKQHVPIRSIEAFDRDDVQYGNGIVHDVLLHPSGTSGYVTYNGDGGLIVEYDSLGEIQSFNQDIDEDSRLAASFRFNCLYAPSQPANIINIIFNGDLQIDNFAEVNAPFAAVSSVDGGYIYISSPTTNSIYTFDVGGNQLLSTTVTTSIAGPTKMTHTGDRLFVSHPDVNTVSVFAATDFDPIPIEVATTKVGNKPFGIAYLAPTQICNELFYDELNLPDDADYYYYGR